ncbi:MAG TPA: DMT family transporter [Candidatus Deferrimicrobium sp.]|nr:DMT family transporter [Candidatus Deferrimicrobium sp.]
MRNFLGNKVWLVGFILTNVHWVILFLALSMAPLSLITPLLGFGLVVLAIFSHFYLHERIQQRELCGIGIIIGGIVLVGITALPDPTTYTIEEMFALFGTSPALIYLLDISFAAGILCFYSISKNYKFAPALIFGFTAGVGGGIGATFTKVLSLGIDDIFAAVGNILWWICLIIMLAGNVVSLVFLNIGFQKGKAVIVGPIFSVLGMILPVFSGIIILAEWQAQTPLSIALQIIGLVIIALGIIILSFYREKKSAENLK